MLFAQVGQSYRLCGLSGRCLRLRGSGLLSGSGLFCRCGGFGLCLGLTLGVCLGGLGGLCVVLFGFLGELDGFDDGCGLLVQELVHDDDSGTGGRHSGGSTQNAEDCFHAMTSLVML